MKKYFLLLLLLLNSGFYAQSMKFFLVTDPKGAMENPLLPADSLRKAFYSFAPDAPLAAIGNITGKGTIEEINRGKLYIDSLSSTALYLPGKNDLTQNISSLFNLNRIFGRDGFIADLGGAVLYGIQSLSLTNNSKAHISYETVRRIKEDLPLLNGKKIILFLNAVPEEITGLERVKSALSECEVIALFTPEFELKKKQTPARRRLREEKKPEDLKYLFAFEIRNDTAFIYSFNSGNQFSLAETRGLGKIDLASIGGKKPAGQTSFLLDKNSTVYAGMLQLKNNLIIGGAEGKVFCYNPEFKSKWVQELTGTIASAPAAAEGNLIAASSKGDIIILNPDNKAEVQSIGIDCEIVSPLTIIDYKGKKELLIPKSTGSRKALVFGGSNGEILCYDLETLQQYWINNDSKSPITGNIIDVNNKLIFRNGEGYVVCIDTRTGQLIWKWNYRDIFADTKSRLYNTGKQIVTLSSANTIAGIDLLLGVAEWESEKGGIKDIFISQSDPNTIAAIGDKKIFFFNSKTGKFRNEIKIKEKNIISFLIPDGYAGEPLLLSSDNEIYRLEKSKTLKYAGYAGNAPVVSSAVSGKNDILILNTDGQLLKITLK